MNPNSLKAAPITTEVRCDASTMPSILFGNLPADAARGASKSPAYFIDLNLDQVVASLTADWDEYDLQPFFYQPLNSADMVAFRQEVFRDLENDALRDEIYAFAAKMRGVRKHLAKASKVTYEGEKQAWFLDAVASYGEAVAKLEAILSMTGTASRGFSLLSDYLNAYTHSSKFQSLVSETKVLKESLAAIRFRVLMRADSFQVIPYEPAPDYSAEIEKTFARFRQGQVKDYKPEVATDSYMNHIEGKILEFVIEQHPELFSRLAAFCSRNEAFIEPAVSVFDREVHFYLAYLNHIGELKREGLDFCYPRVDALCKELYASDAFDIALAHKLIGQRTPVVCNDFELREGERIIVVSGPNQGGKTTFARMFGQIHYLGCLGCPVPGREAKLFLFDSIFTHFEREEHVDALRGKLQDDLLRVRDILSAATSDSIVIFNEIFTSTTIQDATYLSRLIMARLLDLDLLAVWVTFVEELAISAAATISMVSSIDVERPELRTFKIERHTPYGLTHAMSIAEKYGVTYARLKERLQR